MNARILAMTLLLGISSQPWAEEMSNHQHHQTGMAGMDDMGEMEQVVMTQGVISRIDQANQKVGIRHQAIANLKMPPMTMIFALADPTLLKGLQVGDTVSFHAEMPAGKLTLTRLQKQ